MSAIKEHYHDEIEKQIRLYDILELQKMGVRELAELAISRNIELGGKGRQTIIHEILNNQ